MVKKKKIKKLTNLNLVDLTNQTYLISKYDLPYMRCDASIISIDYLALYSEVGKYCVTNNTAVCFYQFDNKFDGIEGIFNAIYYNDEKLLQKYKERFKNVRYAIAPDYSQVGDIPRIENLYRLFKARIVALWLLLECNIITIPNITYANENYFDVMLDGMAECEVVAFSVKGSIREENEKELLLKAIRITVDSLKKLKKIVVYSVATNENYVFEVFDYAASKGIEVIIPSNTLKERNVLLKEVKSNGKD